MTHNYPNEFFVSENHSSAQTSNELVAAPTVPGRRICVTGFIFSSVGAGTVALVENTASAATVLQPIYLPANGTAVAVNFSSPLKLSPNVNLGFTSVSVTNHTVVVMGFYEP